MAQAVADTLLIWQTPRRDFADAKEFSTADSLSVSDLARYESSRRRRLSIGVQLHWCWLA